MYTERELIEGCQKGKNEYQKALYDRFAPIMFSLCMRYARHKHEAEDIMQEGFIRVFSHISSFRFEGSFEGWIKRIMIHTAIKYYNRAYVQKEHIGYEILPDRIISAEAHEKLSAEELMQLVQKLPEGYRLVFNMYAIEGFKHKEIAKMLDIGESTSRSQLTKARNMLQKMVDQLYSIVL